MTADVDVVVRGDAVPVAELLAALGAGGIEPRIPDAEAFARRNLVLLLRHRRTRVDVDLSLGWSGFEQEALEQREIESYGRVRLPFATVADLLVFKAVAGRPRDLADVLSLLSLHRGVDLARVRDRVAVLSELADEPALVSRLEHVISRSRRSKRRPRGTIRKRRP
jgi:hypothetical protein